ncbi:MAG: hypothetical protein JWQ48_2171 [Conexibacter sp.]|jgi:hypothetical protein|nr:hypothetical protein [Conexibacter sp.]
MAAQAVEVLTGGSAEWGNPVRLDKEIQRTPFVASLMNRFTFDDGRVHYLKLHMIGIDEVDNDGEVPTGHGSMEFRDTDGDLLWAESDWFRPDGVDEGVWTFASGTGKWAGASGKIDVVLHGMFDDREQILPPPGPSRYFGFIEGTGKIDAPGLAG